MSTDRYDQLAARLDVVESMLGGETVLANAQVAVGLAGDALAEAKVARVLSAAASRDVGDLSAKLNAHTTVLNALRETQIEQGEQLKEHGALLKEQGEQLKEIKGMLQQLVDGK